MIIPPLKYRINESLRSITYKYIFFFFLNIISNLFDMNKNLFASKNNDFENFLSFTLSLKHFYQKAFAAGSLIRGFFLASSSELKYIYVIKFK